MLSSPGSWSTARPAALPRRRPRRQKTDFEQAANEHVKPNPSTPGDRDCRGWGPPRDADIRHSCPRRGAGSSRAGHCRAQGASSLGGGAAASEELGGHRQGDRLACGRRQRLLGRAGWKEAHPQPKQASLQPPGREGTASLLPTPGQEEPRKASREKPCFKGIHRSS